MLVCLSADTRHALLFLCQCLPCIVRSDVFLGHLTQGHPAFGKGEGIVHLDPFGRLPHPADLRPDASYPLQGSEGGQRVEAYGSGHLCQGFGHAVLVHLCAAAGHLGEGRYHASCHNADPILYIHIADKLGVIANHDEEAAPRALADEDSLSDDAALLNLCLVHDIAAFTDRDIAAQTDLFTQFGRPSDLASAANDAVPTDEAVSSKHAMVTDMCTHADKRPGIKQCIFTDVAVMRDNTLFREVYTVPYHTMVTQHDIVRKGHPLP